MEFGVRSSFKCLSTQQQQFLTNDNKGSLSVITN